MRIQEKGEGIIEITTEVYQARNGGIFMNWGNTIIKLGKDDADIIARDIPNFDNEQYNKFYKIKTL